VKTINVVSSHWNQLDDLVVDTTINLLVGPIDIHYASVIDQLFNDEGGQIKTHEMGRGTRFRTFDVRY
jgi:hypothetical protein